MVPFIKQQKPRELLDTQLEWLPVLSAWAFPVQSGFKLQHERLSLLPTGTKEWQALVKAALYHRVGPIFLQNLRDAGRLDLNIGAPLDLLKRHVKLTQAQNLALAVAAEQIGRVFQENSVDLFFLKGIALRQTSYSSYIARTMSDIDLLVRSVDRDQAEKLLVEIGFERDADNHASLWEANCVSGALKEIPFFKPNAGEPIRVDLHWGLVKGHRSEEITEARIWAGKQPFELRGRKLFGLAPAMALIHLCLHLHKNLVLGQGRLIWFADLVATIEWFGDELPWQEIEEIAKDEDLQQAIEDILQRLHFAAPDCLPSKVVDRYALDTKSFRVEQLMEMNQNLRGQYYRGLLGGMGNRRDRFWFLVGLMFPRPRQLEKISGKKISKAPWKAYFSHWLQAFRIGWRVLTRR